MRRTRGPRRGRVLWSVCCAASWIAARIHRAASTASSICSRSARFGLCAVSPPPGRAVGGGVAQPARF
eukprot:11178775-Lingulodinium_polyedra.AAC.1